ncbi:MAG TPA: NAD(P)-dependent oxidoreductase, partial [Dongiaceae bacterium]|nr:NAD(P)-dependent oxidoreductase [Dongiaceae bacterium]
MKVLIADRLDPGAAAALRAAGHEVEERIGLKEPELIAALAGCAAILVRSATKVTAAVIASAPALKVVARAGTGLDNVDAAAARARGITVLNTPAANAVSVAELVFGLLLALERHLVAACTDLRAGGWEKTKFMGRELAGRRLGLVGFGRIAREVARRARAFDMSVAATDPLLPSFPSEFAWVRATPLDTLLAESDVISLHVPLAPETRGLIGSSALALMRPDAVLVNCARGGV